MHMNFIICFVSEEGKNLTAIATAINQTRRKSMIYKFIYQ
jgi:folate-dependent phosphoribosylglycinamide formyltransferase PurN